MTNFFFHSFFFITFYFLPISTNESNLTSTVRFPSRSLQNVLYPWFQINANDARITPHSQVASFTNGFAVSWQSLANDSNGIFYLELLVQSVQMSTFTGEIKYQPVQIDTLKNINDFNMNPRMVSLNNGQLVTIWLNLHPKTFKSAIYGQIFDINGTVLGEKFPIDFNGTFSNWDQTSPDVSNLQNGGFAVVWANDTQTLAQKFYADGAVFGQYFEVYDGKYPSPKPRIKSLYNGDFIIVFTIGANLMGKLFSKEGKAYRDIFDANTASPVDSYDVSPAPDGFLIIYSWKLNSSYHKMSGQYFDYTGNTLGIEITYDFASITNISNPHIAVLEDKCFILSFERYNEQTSMDVYLAKYDPSGNISTKGANLVKRQDSQSDIYVANLQDNQFVAVLNDVYYVTAQIFTHGEDPFIFHTNRIKIKQGYSINIDNSMIDTLAIGNIAYTAKNVINGYFSLISAKTAPIFTFTQDDINNYKLFFTHDDSLFSPFFYLKSRNETNSSDWKEVSVNFIKLPKFIYNRIEIEQNQQITITNSMVDGETFDNSSPLFVISSNISCHFESKKQPGIAISSFSKENITNLSIIFVAADSMNTPSYKLGITDSDDKTNSSGIISYYIALKVNVSSFSIKQGQSLVITKEMLDVQIDSKLTAKFIVSQALNGHFASKTSLITSDFNIFSFTKEQIAEQDISFIHDGTLNEPEILLLVSDGIVTTDSFKIAIDFIPNCEFINNNLKINKGQNLLITQESIDGNCTQNSQPRYIFFTITNLLHGKFIVKDQQNSTFSLQNIIMKEVFFLHDNSDIAPSYIVSIGVISVQSEAFEAIVSFNGQNPVPILKKNSLDINQGDKKLIVIDNLNASDGVNSDFLFEINDLMYAVFCYSANLSKNITSFFLKDIKNSKVVIIHDNSLNPPYYSVKVSTLQGLTNGFFSKALINFNMMSQLVSNSLQIHKGEKKFLTSDDISAIDSETDSNYLIFYVSDVLYGQFESIQNPSVPIFIFYQSQINSKEILFMHDGSINEPSYKVAVSDGNIKIEAIPAAIEFLLITGVCGLKKIKKIKAEMVKSLAITQKMDFMIAVGYYGDIMLININDPEQAFIETEVKFNLFDSGISKLKEILLVGDLLYVLSETQTMAIISMQNPKDPKLMGFVGGVRIATDFTVCENGYAYLAGLQQGIHIINVKNTNLPIYVKNSSINQNVSSIDCYDDFLYLVTKELPAIKSKFIIMDLKDPINPVSIIELELTAAANYLKFNSNHDQAYIATSVGIDFVKLNNPIDPILLTNISLTSEVLSLDLSDDDIYLMAITNEKVFMINVDNLSTPLLLDNLIYDYGLQKPLFSPRSHFGFLASNMGLLIFNIYRGQLSRISPKLASIIDPDPNFNATHIAISPNGQFYFINALIITNETTQQKNQSLIIKESNSHQILRNLTFQCNNIESPSVAISFDGKTAFVTSCGSLISVNIDPIQSVFISNQIDLDNAWDVAVSSDGLYAYVTNREKNEVYIISTNKTSLLLISTIIIGDPPSIITTDKNNNFLFVLLEGKGLVIIDVANKEKPMILQETEEIMNLGDARSMIYFSDIHGNQYLIITLFYEGMINIINVNNARNAKIIARIFIGKETFGIGLLLNKNYIIIQNYHKLTVIEIRNITDPVIVEQIESNTIKNAYKIAAITTAILLPNLQVIELYNGDTFFYPNIQSHTNTLGQKVFYIHLFAINPKTWDTSQEKNKILSIEAQEDWPYWMVMDYEANVLTLTPPALSALSEIRRLSLKFATQITETELLANFSTNSQEVLHLMMFENYIDSLSIPTNHFNKNIPFVLHTSTTLTATEASKIPDILNKHLITHYITFTIEDFISLDSEPQKSNNSIQSQFDQLGTCQVNKRIDFQMKATSFIDLEGDALTYKAYGIPPFLQFSKENLKFSGTPTKIDIGEYSIRIEAFDGYKSSKQNFTIKITNSAPVVNEVIGQKLILGENFDYDFPTDTFIDPDGDFLTYEATLVYKNGSVANLPNWLNLDRSRLRLYGKPEAGDIEKDEENKRFYHVFTIKLTAIDIADQTSFFLYNLTVENYYPKLNENLTLSNQFLLKYGDYIIINQRIDFEFSPSTFTDKENRLSYTVKGMPSWLSFSGNIFTGTPAKIDLGDYTTYVTASDGFANITDFFIISVKNHAPIPNKIPTFSLIFGKSLTYKLQTPFTDPDNDTLTYKAFSVNETRLVPLPNWLLFDGISLVFSGTPLEKDIPYNSSLNSFFANYSICVIAFDIGGLNSTVNFSLIVQNSIPLVNSQNTLANQFKKLDPQVMLTVEAQFSEDTFFDSNNETLTYEARLLSQESKWLGRRLSEESGDILPDWITFDAKQRKFSISPTFYLLNFQYRVKVIAKNSNLEASDSFQFIVSLSPASALQIGVTIAGIAGFFLGIWAYRMLFYSLCCKNLYCYTEYDKVIIHKKYEKIIYLIKDDLEVCFLIWKDILKKYKKDYKKEFKKKIADIYQMEEKEKILKKIVQESAQRLIKLKKLRSDTELDSYRKNEIFVGLLVNHTMNQLKNLKKVYKAIKNDLRKKGRKQWYQEISLISHPLLEEKAFKPFPKVEILEENLNNLLNLKAKTMYSTLQPFEKNLILDKIKGYIQGIPASIPFWEFSKGESLISHWNELAEIQFVNDKSQNKKVHGSLLTFGMRVFTSSITAWLQYKIEKDMMIFYGEASKGDTGKIIVRIFSKFGYVVREFGCEVLDYEENIDEEMKTQKNSGENQVKLQHISLINKKTKDSEMEIMIKSEEKHTEKNEEKKDN